MTLRVIRGLSHPKAKVLAHPTGRLLNQRPGYELDWEEIFNFCKDNNKALEINSWPTRLDSSYQMENMKYGVSMARRGWATKSDILNTLEYNEFTNLLRR